MQRVADGEGCMQKSVSFRPQKIHYPFTKLMTDALGIDNLGLAVSILIIYFIKNYKKKDFIKNLKSIKNDVIMSKVKIPQEIKY